MNYFYQYIYTDILFMVCVLFIFAFYFLNPLRAGIADTPETSEFTSIQARLEALNNQQETAPCLHPFIGNPTNEKLDGIPFRLMDYIELVDWSARQFRENKACLEARMPSILQRFNQNKRNWLKACTELERHRSTAVGCICTAEFARSRLNKKRIHLFRLDV